MKGFKDFIMRGNLVELAVAFIIGAAFATVVKSFTDMLLEIIAKAGGAPNFDKWEVFGLTKVGPFLSALFAFLIIAFVVYFFVVKPYEMARERFVHKEEDAAPPEDVQVLKEIRDLLASRPTV
jgi:large conductance mechanosensitive channel